MERVAEWMAEALITARRARPAPHAIEHLYLSEPLQDSAGIDGIVLWDLDYIDLGRIRWPSQTVPVTVKSLVFSDDPRHPADPHLH